MKIIDAAKPSLKGYLRSRRIIAHPVFILMQVIYKKILVGLWINYKRKAFQIFGIDFVKANKVFFELQADIGASFFLSLYVLAVRKGSDIFLQWNIKFILLNFLAGVFIFATQLMFCLGLKTSEASFTAPWMLLNPIFVTILALFFGYETSERIKTIGLITSICGTIGLIIVKSSVIKSIYKPVCFLFVSSVCNASSIIIWRNLLLDYKQSPIIVVTWSLIVASIFMSLAYITEPYWFNEVTFHGLHTNFNGCSDIIFCCFLIMLGYAVTFGIMGWATHKSSISIVTLYTGARPLFTVILSFLITPDNPLYTFISIMLLTVVFFGLITSSYSKKRAKEEKRSKAKKNLKETLSKKFAVYPMAEVDTEEFPNRLVYHK